MGANNVFCQNFQRTYMGWCIWEIMFCFKGYAAMGLYWNYKFMMPQ